MACATLEAVTVENLAVDETMLELIKSAERHLQLAKGTLERLQRSLEGPVYGVQDNEKCDICGRAFDPDESYYRTSNMSALCASCNENMRAPI